MKKNVLIYLGSSFFMNLLPLLFLPLFTRFLSPEDYGVVALALAFGSVTAGLSTLGLNLLYDRNYFEAEKQNKHGELIFTYLLFSIFATLFWTVLIIILEDIFSLALFHKTGFLIPLLWGHLSVSINKIRELFLSYYKNSGDAKAHSILSIMTTLFGYLAVVIFLVVYGWGLDGYMLGLLMMQLVVVIIVMGKFIYDLEFKFSFKLLKTSIKDALPLTPRIFLGVLSTNFDKYMIGMLVAIGGVGIYSIGQKFAYGVFILMTALGNVFSPQTYRYMFEGDTVEIRSKIGKYLTPFFYISALIALMVGMFSKEIVRLLVTKEFYAAESIIPILALYYLILFFGKQNQLIYAKKMWLISMLSFVNIALNISLNIFMIKYYGVLGAAIATLLVGVVMLGLGLYLGQREYRILFEKNKIVLILSGVIVGVCLPLLPIANDLLLIFIKVAYLGLFIFLGNFLRIFTSTSIKELFQFKR